VELDEVADDREAETQAAERPRDGSIGLPEALEEVGEEFGPDALARVANRQLEVGVHALEHDVDAPALGGELDRVGEEIPHHCCSRSGSPWIRSIRGSSLVSTRMFLALAAGRMASIAASIAEASRMGRTSR